MKPRPLVIPPASEAPTHRLVVSLGDPIGHSLAIARGFLERADDRVELAPTPHAPPRLERMDGTLESEDWLSIVDAVAPGLLERGPAHADWLERVRGVLEGAHALGAESHQGIYERKVDDWAQEVRAIDEHLRDHRYVLGGTISFADLLLFCFAVRIDAVHHVLWKANVYLLEDLPVLHAHARDLFERPEVWQATDWDALVREPHEEAGDLNPRGLIPLGGRPALDAPHFRQSLSVEGELDASVEEDPNAARAEGEWVRGLSRHRARVGDPAHPPQAGRYHLFAPLNCPWSHRALLGRAVKGLDAAVGASIVYFRRDPERGWQFNPAIPGCTEDRVHGRTYVAEYYEAEGSEERSVPFLYDTLTERIVNNESADILRMFDDAFGPLATRGVSLYPEAHRAEIDRLNEEIYQRINNGAYKAGFARTQAAYARAFERYFAGLAWIESRLRDRPWLVDTDHPTEADLRLFPTIFRHDAVYYARFRLDAARVRDYPRLADWLRRMLDWPGVADASDLDHARNGYFGRTGNEIVPAGPVPLALSPKDFSRDTWLNRK